MIEQEMLEIIRIPGRYEIVSKGDNYYVCIPIDPAAILITPESDADCREYYLDPDN